MNDSCTLPLRRDFLKASAAATLGLVGCAPDAAAPPPATMPAAPAESPTIVGPRKGFSPQIGTLVSMMGFMRQQVLSSVKGMSKGDLDFLLDGKANRIGALLLHLVATERLYQANTFDSLPLDKLPATWSDTYGVAMDLGEPARKAVLGHELDFYLKQLEETRELTLAEFRKRDDAWLMAVDPTFPWGPTNNYCKWFHVTEHEANHNGQIKLLKSRLASAGHGGE